MDISELKKEADERANIEAVRDTLLQLNRTYNSLWESDVYTTKANAFRDDKVEEFKDYLNQNGFEFAQDGDKFIGTYKSAQLSMKLKPGGFIMQSSKHELGFPVFIDESEKSKTTVTHVSFLNGDKVDFAGGVRNRDSISFLEREVYNLEQDIAQVKAKMQNIGQVDFVCVFEDQVGIEGEFSSIKDIIARMLESM